MNALIYVWYDAAVGVLYEYIIDLHFFQSMLLMVPYWVGVTEYKQLN